MKLAIMQPYFFPYLGYFQLIGAVDRFVFYDDVHFIKGGWINRNRILVNKSPFLFTLPLKDSSSFRLINEIELDHNKMAKWRDKFLMTLDQSYKKAPYFQATKDVVESVLLTEHETVGDIAKSSVLHATDYLGMKTSFVMSSSRYQNKKLNGQQRVLDICLKEGCQKYINVQAGSDLYNKRAFTDNAIDLQFLESMLVPYTQGVKEFVPGLSIIDIMMHNSISEIKSMLQRFILK